LEGLFGLIRATQRADDPFDRERQSFGRSRIKPDRRNEMKGKQRKAEETKNWSTFD
jgi:hypothetical protein